MTLTPRLRSLIDAALQYRITEIIAPAGFGKSTIIDELARSRGFAVARIRPGKDASLALMQALCDAVAIEAPDLQLTLPAAYANAQLSQTTAEFATWFLDWLPGLKHAIAIDDLQYLGDDSTAWLILRQIIESAGYGSRWLLAGRTWLHLPNIDWIASGVQGPSIEQSALAFTSDDLQRVGASLGLGVSADVARELLEATHGWPLLVMYSLRLLLTERDPRSVAAAVRGRGVDVVANRVLSSVNTDDRSLLAAVALYDGVLPELLEQTNPGAASALVRLASNGIPLVQGNDQRWRLHDVIRLRILERDPNLRISESQRLCQLLECSGNLRQALEIAIAGRSADLVRDVLERNVSHFIHSSDTELLQRGLALFAREAIEENAKLALLRGELEMKGGRPSVSIAFIKRAVELSNDRDRAFALARLGLGLMNWQGHASEGFALLRSAATAVAPARPEEACEVHGCVAWGLAIEGDTRQASDHIASAIDILPQIRDPISQARVYLRAAQVSFCHSNIREAESYLSQTIHLCEQWSLFDVLVRALEVAKYLAAPDSEEQAIKFARESIEYSRRTLDITAQYHAEASLFIFLSRAGNLDAATHFRNRVLPVPVTLSPRFGAVLLMTAALFSMQRGEMAQAEGYLSSISSFGEEAVNRNIMPLREVMFHSYAAILNELKGLKEDALASARRSYALASKIVLKGFDISGTPELEIAKICCAAIFGFNGRMSEAHAILDDMASNALEQYRRDLARWVSDLVGNPAAEPSEEARTRANGIITLLRRCAKCIETTSLTRAERRVLDALAEGMSTKGIAAMTGRSTKTVNNQVTSILRKLQARSRGEAVALARRRGLFAEPVVV